MRGEDKRLMIYGKKQIITEEGMEEIQARGEKMPEQSMYDYLGVFYPEGYMDEE